MKIPEEKRNRIIDAAVLEFATHGYDNANTNKIAKNAHISVGSLFQYFESKEYLFLTIVKYCSQLLIKAFEEVVVESDSFSVTIEKILRKIINESRENPNIVKLYFEMSSPSKLYIVQQAVNELESYSYKLYCSTIRKGQEQGIIRKDCDVRIFSFLLDNIFMMLQYSYSCGYYQERFKIYGGESILGQDDLIVEQSLKFIKAAFSA
jgi:TetR/AcrR family transcriptional regulator